MNSSRLRPPRLGKRLIVGVCLFIQDHGGGHVLLSGRKCASRYANAMMRPNSVSTVLSEAEEGLFSIFTPANEDVRIGNEFLTSVHAGSGHMSPPSNRLQTNTGVGEEKNHHSLICFLFFF